MAIIKRDSINNTIFRELEQKYPPLDAENGVAYKQKLDYLTFEPDFMTDAKFRKLRNHYGNNIIAIIFSLRIEMCSNGWNIRMDNEYYDSLLDDCSYMCNVEKNIVASALNDLINEHIFYVVADERIKNSLWLTCPQQVYNYEMACNNRKLSRTRKAKSRANAKDSQNVALYPKEASQQNDREQDLPPTTDLCSEQDLPCNPDEFYPSDMYTTSDPYLEDELPFE